MEAAQWAQAMEPNCNINSSINNPTNTTNNINISPRGQAMVERRGVRPQKEQNLNCPRCNSTNTKFCYYNNYSLTQPRYFCKTCRRYWTQGGSLRNVPVGGGSRKNKRSSSSSSSSSSMTQLSSTPSSMAPKLIPDLNPPNSLPHHHHHHLLAATSQNPKFLQGQDLNLAFPIQPIFHPMDHQHPHHHQFPKIETNNTNNDSIHGNIPTTSAPIAALELLRTGIATRATNLGSYLPIPMAIPPDSNNIFPSSGLIPRHDHHHQQHEDDGNMLGSGAANNAGARLLFPFADMNKLASPTNTTTTQHHEIDDHSKAGNDDDDHHHSSNHDQGQTGYWTGMLGGGTW